MRLDPSIFREYDIRGEVDTQFGPEVVERLGAALARYFRRGGEERVLVGRDNRLSGPRLQEALIRGLTGQGCRVLDIGTVITPVFYYARHLYGINAGAMLTASHNPPEYNGLKVAFGPGTIYGEEIQEVRRIAEAGEDPDAGGAAGPAGPAASAGAVPPAGPVEEADAGPAYLDMLAEKIRLGPRPLKVAVDCGNGTASLFAPEALRRMGCEVLPLYCESDGTFPHHHPDPVRNENLRDLKALVAREGADVGVAFDGDGDRLGVVDEAGKTIWGDELMILYWRELLPRYPGAQVLVEVKCSQALVDEVERLGGEPIFSKTGHSLIKAKMREIGAVFTGEMSGHMFFADEYFGYDDAVYAAGRLLRILSHADRSLSELLADAPRYYSTAETRVPCSDAHKFDVVARLTEVFRKDYEVVDVDGARVLFGDGWGLVRASNTQPAIVARCEGTTPEALERIGRIMRTELLRHPEVGDFQWDY